MAFKKPSIKKSTNDIAYLRVYLRAIKKWGKTTLFRDYIKQLYNGDVGRGLLIGVGYEQGYDMLDDLNTTHINSWQELTELKEWLIKEKGKEHNIEIIAFDVVDELIPIAEREVLRLSEIKTKKKSLSINSAFGGYNEGRKQVKILLKSLFADLRSAGFSYWAIAHTKERTIKEKGMGEDEGYNVLTSNIELGYDSIFSDIFDCVLTGYIDRDVVDGRVVSSVRKLAFRGDTTVDAGCRFGTGSIPEYMECDDTSSMETARKFIDILECGLRGSKSKEMDKKEFDKLADEERNARKEIHIDDTKLPSKEEMINNCEEVGEEEEPSDTKSDTTSENSRRKELLKAISLEIKDKKVVDYVKEMVKKEGVSRVSELSDEALIKIEKDVLKK